MIQWKSYYHYDTSKNNALCFTDINDITYYFSYNTLVAFSYKDNMVCRQNEWGTVTAKHLNVLERNHNNRVTEESFNIRLANLRKKFQQKPPQTMPDWLAEGIVDSMLETMNGAIDRGLISVYNNEGDERKGCLWNTQDLAWMRIAEAIQMAILARVTWEKKQEGESGKAKWQED